MNATQQRKLKYHLREVAKLLQDDTPEAQLQDFASIELAARKPMVETVGPEIGEFFCQTEPKARPGNGDR